MNRSLWPEGCEVHQQDLARDTQDTIDAIASRYTSATFMGIAGGLEVTPAVAAGKIQVSNGTGYSPNGEQIIVPVAQNNISLATYTATALNYVIAVYTEIYGDPRPHEDLGTTLPTSAVGSFRIAVLTASAWNALPVSDPNLNNNSRDRSVLLAIVTANGSSLNPIVQGDIQGPAAYSPVYFISQPATISGVRIAGVSVNTLAGSGTLTYTIAAGQRKLQWAAPGDTAGPVSAVITANSTITLFSASASPQYTITVVVTFIDLPAAPPTIVNNITVSSIYAQPIPRLSAIDDAHRHMLGSGIPNVNNPHALTLADIGADIGGVIQQHQVEMHANGLLDPFNIGAASPSLRTTILGTGTSNDVVHVAPITTDGIIYINGLRIPGIVGSSNVAFDDVNINYIELYGVYMQANGTLTKTLRLQLNPPPSGSGEVAPLPDPFSGSIQPVDISDYNTVFDPLQDIQIAFNKTAAPGGQPAFRLVPPSGWAWPITWTPVSNWNGLNILRLPYPTSPTDTTIPAAAALNYIDVWVNPAFLVSPPTSTSVFLRIYERPSPETSYLISYVVSQGIPLAYGVTTVMLGWGPYANPVIRTDHTIDRRLFGTLAGIDINNNTIGKEKIKDLSNSQVINAIGYIPYDGIANLRPFALNRNAVDVVAGPSGNSAVKYAEVAGSGGTTTTWPSLVSTGTVPAALAGMVSGNTFNQNVFFNYGLEMPQNQVVRWTSSGALVGDALGQISSTGPFISNSFIRSATYLQSMAYISAQQYITAGGYITSGGDVNLPLSNTYTVKNVKDPLVDYDAANKRYVDSKTSVIIVSGIASLPYPYGSAWPSGIVNITWAGAPSENEWTFSWNSSVYNFLSIVCTGANPDPGNGSMLTIKTMFKTASTIRMGTFSSGGAWDNYPFYWIMTFQRI